MELQLTSPEHLDAVIRELTEKGATVSGSGYGVVGEVHYLPNGTREYFIPAHAVGGDQ